MLFRSYLGLKGILSTEIKASGASKDVHSANAPIIPNPAWLLIWALNLLKDKEEKVLIPDFYENVLISLPKKLNV